MDSKECKGCNETKDLSNFYKLKNKLSYGVYCKSCIPELKFKYNIPDMNNNFLYTKGDSTLDRQRLFRRTKISSTKRNLEFNLTIDDIVIPELCPYFGVPLDTQRFKPSVDRIDSTKGYIKGNIQVISLLANVVKNDTTNKELLEFCKNYLLLHS